MPNPHADEDKRRRKLAEARNVASSTVYQTEKLLKEHAEKLDESSKSAIQSSIEKVNESVKGEDGDAIMLAVDELNQAVQAFSKHLYEQASQTGGNGRPEAASGEPTMNRTSPPADRRLPELLSLLKRSHREQNVEWATAIIDVVLNLLDDREELRNEIDALRNKRRQLVDSMPGDWPTMPNANGLRNCCTTLWPQDAVRNSGFRTITHMGAARSVEDHLRTAPRLVKTLRPLASFFTRRVNERQRPEPPLPLRRVGLRFPVLIETAFHCPISLGPCKSPPFKSFQVDIDG